MAITRVIITTTRVIMTTTTTTRVAMTTTRPRIVHSDIIIQQLFVHFCALLDITYQLSTHMLP